MTKLFVGNLGSGVTRVDLPAAFAAYGQVSTAELVMDRPTGTSRGFGFVEKGRTLSVSPARPRSEGGRRGSPLGGSAVVGDVRHRW